MKYQSTRSNQCVNDPTAVLKGLAEDGGLFVPSPEVFQNFDWKACLQKDSLGMATEILGTLLPGFPDMDALVHAAYRNKFETEDLTPLVSVGDYYVLELFRGPTSAFKDVALSMLPHLITAAKKVTGETEETLILTATSGDTGKAALEGFHDVEGTHVIVFFPDNGVSPVQKMQMVTQCGKNVRVCAVRGNFDDCQRGVKETFAKVSAEHLTDGTGVALSSANSINIGRLAPQVVYYFIAYQKLVEQGRIQVGDPVRFSVPTGNFGDILAGYYAKCFGLPIDVLLCASNENRVLTDFFETGTYDRRREFYRTSSPSMDILVSSNLERMLYMATNGNVQEVAGYMNQLNTEGLYTVSPAVLRTLRQTFRGDCTTEKETEEVIGRVFRDFGYLCDPHTAVAFHAAENYRKTVQDSVPMVVLSTASPYKFPTPVLKAIGQAASGDEFEQIDTLNRITAVPVPKNLLGLREKEILHTDLIGREDVTDYVLSHLPQKSEKEEKNQ